MFPLHLDFLLLSRVPLYCKRLCDTPSALLSYTRVYVSKGEYLRTEEKCMLVPCSSLNNMVFSQCDYSVALPFQSLPLDFLHPRSTPQAQS